MRLALLSVLLLGFLGLTEYTLTTVGYVGFFEAMRANAATNLAMVDIVVALSLVLVWVFRDARERGLPFWPYALVTLGFGSAGPLAYLIHRELRGLRARTAARAAS